jgi:hypothetical protein
MIVEGIAHRLSQFLNATLVTNFIVSTDVDELSQEEIDVYITVNTIDVKNCRI